MRTMGLVVALTVAGAMAALAQSAQLDCVSPDGKQVVLEPTSRQVSIRCEGAVARVEDAFLFTNPYPTAVRADYRLALAEGEKPSRIVLLVADEQRRVAVAAKPTANPYGTDAFRLAGAGVAALVLHAERRQPANAAGGPTLPPLKVADTPEARAVLRSLQMTKSPRLGFKEASLRIALSYLAEIYHRTLGDEEPRRLNWILRTALPSLWEPVVTLEYQPANCAEALQYLAWASGVSASIETTGFLIFSGVGQPPTVPVVPADGDPTRPILQYLWESRLPTLSFEGAEMGTVLKYLNDYIKRLDQHKRPANLVMWQSPEETEPEDSFHVTNCSPLVALHYLCWQRDYSYRVFPHVVLVARAAALPRELPAPAEPLSAELQRALPGMVVPMLSFYEAEAGTVCRYLDEYARRLDKDGVLQRVEAWRDEKEPATGDKAPLLTLEFENVPLPEAWALVAAALGVKYRFVPAATGAK